MISLGLHKRGGSLELDVKVGQALPDDEHVCMLLVLLELVDLLLFRRNVVLPDVYVSGINNGLPSLCLRVPWYLQSRKAQRFVCLCDVGPTFILSLYVVGYRIERRLVFGRLFRDSDVKGVAFKS